MEIQSSYTKCGCAYSRGADEKAHDCNELELTVEVGTNVDVWLWKTE